MQSTVSCDHVFDVLTRQPFPSGADDDDLVEEHIRSCHACRRLAEALRPAVNLIHESIDASNRMGRLPASPFNDLPRFSGLADEAEDLAILQVMDQVRLESETKTERQPSGWRPRSLVGVACLAAAVMFMFIASQPDAKGCEDLASNQERFEYLLGTGVPLGCLANVGWHPPVGNAIDDLEDQPAAESCCTDCHNAAKNVDKPIDNFKPLAQSCQACHDVDESQPKTKQPNDGCLKDLDTFKPLAQSCLACHSAS